MRSTSSRAFGECHKQIEILVRTIQADTNEAIVSMERSTTDVVGGALLAENAGAALEEIEQVSNQIASLVQNISGSAREQAGAAAAVIRNVEGLQQDKLADRCGHSHYRINRRACRAGSAAASVSGWFHCPPAALSGALAPHRRERCGRRSCYGVGATLPSEHLPAMILTKR